MESRKFNLWTPALILGLLIMFAINLKTCNEKELTERQLKAATDTTRVYRNKKGQLVAEKTAFVGDRKEAKEEIKRWKEALATEVTKSTKAIILLKRELKIAKSGIVKTDTFTVYIADVKIDTPSISIDTGDAFHSLKFAANKAKYAYEIKIIDVSELKIDDKGKKGTLVTLLNKNPYVTSTEIKSVVIPPKKPSLFSKAVKVGIGVGLGYLIFR